MPGRHNLQNALAAVAVGDRARHRRSRASPTRSPTSTAPSAASSAHGEAGGVLVVDDYGHHPTEIRGGAGGGARHARTPAVVAFQPHRYSRTAHLHGRFGPALRDADEIVLTDIYAAGEEPIPGVTDRGAGRFDARADRDVRCIVVKALDDVVPAIVAMVAARRRRHHARRRLDRLAAEASPLAARSQAGGAAH